MFRIVKRTSLVNQRVSIEWRFIPIYLVMCLVFSQLVMAMDDALFAAYVVIPMFVFGLWARSANIRWGISRRAYVFYLLGQLILGFVTMTFYFFVLEYEESGAHTISLGLLNTLVEYVAFQNQH